MDRFIAGWLAGIAGGILMNIWSFVSYHLLQFSQHRFIDWSGVMLYGEIPNSTAEILVALIMQLIFAGFTGALFAILLPLVSGRHHLLKGVIYSLTVTFIFFSIPTLFREPIFSHTPVDTVISNNIGAIIWGLTTAALLQRINIKSNLRI
jgi:hypothetical protein